MGHYPSLNVTHLQLYNLYTNVAVHKCRTKLYTSVVLALYTNVSVHNCLPPYETLQNT